MDQYVCRLHQRAASCDFGAAGDDYIRDQIIDKCYSSNLRRKLLEKEKLTLKEIMDTARAQEAVDHQVKVMETKTTAIHVNRVTNQYDSRQISKGKECFACEHQGHFAKDKKCPAQGQVCKQCGKLGHFKAKCMQGRDDWKSLNVDRSHRRQQDCSRDFKRGGRGGQSFGNRGHHTSGPRMNFHQTKTTKQNSNTNCVDERARAENENSPHYAFAVEDEYNFDKGIVTLNIGGIEVNDILIDSGAISNLLSQQT
jgi:hypothetical protein